MAEEIKDIQMKYPYISEDAAKNLQDLDASAEQWEAYNVSSKRKIDEALCRYRVKKPYLDIMVIGETGSGKSATANTLLGRRVFTEGSSSESVTRVLQSETVHINGVQLRITDTPGSWQTAFPKSHEKEEKVNCYIFVINLASPRFSADLLTKLKHLKGTNGEVIVDSGQFFVVLTHADSALRGKCIKEHVEQISGDPLHTFLTDTAKGRILAVNNTAETEYEKTEHQKALFMKIVAVSMENEEASSTKRPSCRIVPEEFEYETKEEEGFVKVYYKGRENASPQSKKHKSSAGEESMIKSEIAAAMETTVVNREENCGQEGDSDK